jgi:hypothetical protein
MPIEVDPGSPLICVLAGTCLCGCSRVTLNAMYFCENVDMSLIGFILHTAGCTIDKFAGITTIVKGKIHRFCANRFVPLDPNDTSLLDKAQEDTPSMPLTLPEYAER